MYRCAQEEPTVFTMKIATMIAKVHLLTVSVLGAGHLTFETERGGGWGRIGQCKEQRPPVEPLIDHDFFPLLWSAGFFKNPPTPFPTQKSSGPPPKINSLCELRNWSSTRDSKTKCKIHLTYLQKMLSDR